MMRALSALALMAVLLPAQIQQPRPGTDGGSVADDTWPPGLPEAVDVAALILESEDRRYAADGLLELTVSSDIKIRSRAALALGRVGSPRLLSRLIELTRDPISVVRASAAFALGRLEYDLDVVTEDADRTRARDALLPLLDDADGQVAQQAAWAVGLVDGGAATEVAAWLQLAGRSTPEARPDPAVLAALLNSWWRLGGAHADATRPFTGWPDAAVRLAAAHALRRLTDPNALPQLLPLLDDPDAEVQLMALRGLRASPQRVAESHAVRLLATRDRRLQCEALAWLETTWAVGDGTPGDDAFVTALRRSLDRDLHVRSCALRALATTVRSRGVAADRLLEALGEEGEGVRVAALQGLVQASEKLREEAVARVRAREGFEDAVDATPQVLAYLDESRLEAQWFVRALARSEEPSDTALVAALSRSGPRAVRVALMAELEERSPEQAYQRAFNLIDGDLAEEALDLIARRHQAAYFRDEPELQAQIADGLWRRYFDPRSSESRGPRLAALRALLAVSRDLVVPRLSLIRDEPDRFVRLAALSEFGSDAEEVRRDVDALLAPHASGRDRGIYVELARRALGIQSQPTRMRLQTERGDALIELRPDWAPLSVLQLIDLTTSGFYDGSRFHRVIAGFVTQGGASPSGSLAPALRNEDSPIAYVRGSVGLARAGRDSARSQFFITHAAQPHLTGEYALVGELIEGQRAVELTQPGDRMRVHIEP